jgi:hypothetical protein
MERGLAGLVPVGEADSSPSRLNSFAGTRYLFAGIGSVGELILAQVFESLPVFPLAVLP